MNHLNTRNGKQNLLILKLHITLYQESPFHLWTQMRPKKNTNARQIIVDLSYPRNNSVISGIYKGFYIGCPFRYTLPNIMNVADETFKLGSTCFIWSANLARSYRQLCACPLSVPLYGIQVDLYISLSFGQSLCMLLDP